LRVGGAALVGGAAVFGATRPVDTPAPAADVDTPGATTLRKLNGLADKPAPLASSALIMVDSQSTYTRRVMELTGRQAAPEPAAEPLARSARRAGRSSTSSMAAGRTPRTTCAGRSAGSTTGSRPSRVRRPWRRRPPNAFANTDLGRLIGRAGNENLGTAGFMTHMCVTCTAQGAFTRGDRSTVVADACATRPLPSVGGGLSAGQIHQSAPATIADLYGVVVASHTVLT
jgi:hypothetical protein